MLALIVTMLSVGHMNVWTQFHGNPSNSCDLLLITHLMMRLEEKSVDHQSQWDHECLCKMSWQSIKKVVEIFQSDPNQMPYIAIQSKSCSKSYKTCKLYMWDIVFLKSCVAVLCLLSMFPLSSVVTVYVPYNIYKCEIYSMVKNNYSSWVCT